MLAALQATMAFEEAAVAVLRHLHEHVPMAFWSVTRVENGRQTYLYLEDNGYGLRQGDAHPWEASFCIHMAAGSTPAVATDARAVPLYAGAEVARLVSIGSYGGARIDEPDGSLFGAICGIDPQTQDGDSALAKAEPVLALLGRLLTLVLAAERGRQDAVLAVATAEEQADRDALTHLPNRRAWDRALVEEQAQVQRYGDPTVIVVIDLDGLKDVNDTLGHAVGDDHLRRAATALRSAVRTQDVVARLGGDEFGVVLRRCEEASAPARVHELSAALESRGVAASLGWAPLTIAHGADAAVEQADAAMYDAKRLRQLEPQPPAPRRPARVVDLDQPSPEPQSVRPGGRPAGAPPSDR